MMDLMMPAMIIMIVAVTAVTIKTIMSVIISVIISAYGSIICAMGIAWFDGGSRQ